jgi:phosphoribosylcarboxyaminoimidazole (NCAIR) mutase
MAGGIASIAGTAASTAAIPIIGWAVGGALLFGLAAWGVYKLANADS